MFILRQVSEKGESNTLLGHSYTITHEVHQPEQFKEHIKNFEDEKLDHLCAYVFSEGGECFRIYNNDSTFIMSENGKTFARLG